MIFIIIPEKWHSQTIYKKRSGDIFIDFFREGKRPFHSADSSDRQHKLLRFQPATKPQKTPGRFLLSLRKPRHFLKKTDKLIKIKKAENS